MMYRFNVRHLRVWMMSLLALVALTAGAIPARAAAPAKESSGDPQPPPMISPFFPTRENYVAPEQRDIKVVEHRGDSIPLSLQFTDDTGQKVRLSNYFDGNRPVLIQLGYYECPMLCDIISKGMMECLKQSPLTAGTDYQVLFVSVNPADTYDLAYQKRHNYVAAYGRGNTLAGWHFLVGKQGDIKQLAAALGWEYKWVQEKGQFSHPSTVIVCTADGKISRYLYGVKFDPAVMTKTIQDAAGNQIGSALPQIPLTCLQFDGHQGKFAEASIHLMQFGGALSIVVVAILILRLGLRHRRSRADETTESN